jgi:hypothetical protein
MNVGQLAEQMVSYTDVIELDSTFSVAALQHHNSRYQNAQLGQFRVRAYTAFTNRQVCLADVGVGSERGTFPSNFRCGSALATPDWVYILQSPGVDGKLYEIMDQGPQVILHSNHLIAQPDENIGQYGTIVYVLMTDVVEHNGTDVAPNVDLDLISTPPSPGSSSDGYLGVEAIWP